MSKVSILIPVFNAELFLDETLQSAINQTWQNTEIIVVDDGSTDNSLAVAKQYESNKVKIISRKNKGSAVARNTAFRHAQGDYIQYLDADDLLSPDKIRKQLDLLHKYGDQYIVSSAWGRFVRSIDEAEFIHQKVWDNLDPVEWLVAAWEGGGMMQTACWLTPRKLIEKAGLWNETLKSNPADDGEFFCRVLLQSKGVKFCSGAKVYYRSQLPESVSKNISSEAVLSLFLNCVQYEKHILEAEDSFRTRHACMINYLNFIYRFHPHYPDLIEKAKKRIANLGFKKYDSVGGRKFRKLSWLVGFNNALKIRGFWRRRQGKTKA